MATLYVENVPEELYESLRQRAHSNRRSISAETILLLERMLPTAAELRRRDIGGFCGSRNDWHRISCLLFAFL